METSPQARSDDAGTGDRHPLAHALLARMRSLAWLTVALAGLIMILGGAFALGKGSDAKQQVRDKLVAQKIVTPDDASRPGQVVDDATTAQSMAEVIDKHAREAAGGQTYAEIGRFLDASGNPTSDEEKAAKNPTTGRPVENPIRNVAFQASTLQTSLYTSVMAFNVADLVMGLGLAFIALGLGCWVVGVPVVWTVTRRL
jgi:hypothetical protein